MTNDLYLRDMNQYPVFLIFLKPFDTTNDHVAMVINTEDIKYNEHNCCYSYEKIFGGILTWSGNKVIEMLPILPMLPIQIIQSN